MVTLCSRIREIENNKLVLKSQRHHEGGGMKPWGVWLRAEEPRRRQGGDLGGEFGQGFDRRPEALHGDRIALARKV